LKLVKSEACLVFVFNISRVLSLLLYFYRPFLYFRFIYQFDKSISRL